MAAVEPFGSVRKHGRARGADGNDGTHRRAGPGGKGVEHRTRGLARGDHVDCGGGLERRDDVRIIEGALNEPAGVYAVDGRANYVREIVSKW
jgi:hypothetical protein